MSDIAGIARKLLSVLIVDDVAVARDLTRAMLRSLEVTKIFDASNGTDAVDLFRRVSPNVVFLDICMPGVSGLQALGQMLEENPSAYIVMNSAESTQDNVSEALKLGAKGFIVKPFCSQKVREILDKYILYKASRE